MKNSRISRSFLSLIALVIGSSCWVTTLPVHGASTSVSIVDFSFNPSTVTINVNDSVVWNWVGPTTHTSTSDTSLWDSGFMGAGNTQFSHMFGSSGSFPSIARCTRS